MKQYLIYLSLSLLLILGFEIYRNLNHEVISTYIIASYVTTMGLSTLFVNLGKIVTLSQKLENLETTITKGFITLSKEYGKEYGRLESRIEKLEKYVKDQEKK